MNRVNLIAAAPVGVLVFCAISILLIGLFRSNERPFPRLIWGVGSCVVAWLASVPMYYMQTTAWHGMVFADSYTFFFNTILLLGTALTFLLNDEQLEGQKVTKSLDVDVLLLLAVAGGMVMVSANNLITLFVGFELLSVSVYVLTGLAKMEKASTEGALKYFVLGAFSSAFLLYGMTLVYGATGTMEISQIGAAVNPHNLMLLIGLGLMIFGFGFKVSLVPFHFWTPDVYQGAPVSIAGFMAVVVKAAAFAAFFRVMYSSFASLSEAWIGMLWLLSVLTMTVGNFIALRQKSIKRMLAYSSVAHAGYALMGFLVLGAAGGGEAMAFYMLVYTFMTISAFGVVLLVTSGSKAQYEADDISSLAGVGWTHPLLGLAMTFAMLSLAGMPPLAGFMGKFYLFGAAVKGGFVGLAIIAALNSVVSLYYYLRVIVVMFFSERPELGWEPPRKIPFGANVALVITTLATVYVGLFSADYYGLARDAVKGIGS